MLLFKDECLLYGLGQILVLEQLLEKKQAQTYIKLALQECISLPLYLVKNNILSATQIANTTAHYFSLPFLNLDCIVEQGLELSSTEKELISAYNVLPFSKKGGLLSLAIVDPSQQASLKEIQFRTGCNLELFVVEADKLDTLMKRILANSEFADLFELKNLTSLSESASSETDHAPLVKFIDDILLEALKLEVSDIHFEPFEERYRVRYREDGVLREVLSPPLILSTRIAARIKVLSRLDLAEKRVPQDGSFKMNVAQNSTVNFRVSICPTIMGEKIVIRILNSYHEKLKIDSLGFNEHQKRLFLEAIKKPQGMILVTGPTGSGKSTTLYSALNLLNTAEVNILTLEDPVEIKISGVNQVSINPKTGLTFSETLRSFLRQDPDIIMLGEIRDVETAEIAVKAAHTGHLVLSTLHTNSAAETLHRLLSMGIPSYNIISSINLILSQRLVRILCNHCKIIRKDLTPTQLLAYGLKPASEIYKARGCKLCSGGYKGRIALFEMLIMTQALEELILAKASSNKILELALAEGMISLYQSGLEKLEAGITSIEELQRIIAE